MLFGSKNWASVYLASTPQQAAEMGLEFPGVDEVRSFLGFRNYSKINRQSPVNFFFSFIIGVCLSFLLRFILFFSVWNVVNVVALSTAKQLQISLISRIELFLWNLYLGGLSTNDRIHNRNLKSYLNPISCFLCKNDDGKQLFISSYFSLSPPSYMGEFIVFLTLSQMVKSVMELPFCGHNFKSKINSGHQFKGKAIKKICIGHLFRNGY